VVDGDPAQPGRLGAADHPADALGDEQVRRAAADHRLQLAAHGAVEPLALAPGREDAVVHLVVAQDVGADNRAMERNLADRLVACSPGSDAAEAAEHTRREINALGHEPCRQSHPRARWEMPVSGPGSPGSVR
jgi:hypothetical protein